jgi:hypothetical protein
MFVEDLKVRYSYSNTIVYNNFPWPENPTEKQKETIEKAAQKVLDVRDLPQFPSFSRRGTASSGGWFACIRARPPK